jgi:hypothetical protein
MRQVFARNKFYRLVPLLALFVFGACDNDNGTGPGDTVAPSMVTNLAAGGATPVSLVLTWTATGDDGATGTAHRYDIRYSTSVITSANFASAEQATGEPAPTAAGSAQTMTVTGLTSNTPYDIAMKTMDEGDNWSVLSNVAQATTANANDTIRPGPTTTLGAGTITTNSVVLTWTAVGDDSLGGTSSRFDVRYSTSAVTSANFASAYQVTGEPTPAATGTAQSMTVTGLDPYTSYFFALKTSDEVPNWSELSNVIQVSTMLGDDAMAPATIISLGGSAVTATSVILSWTAPGDDGSAGTAAEYDLRFSHLAITDGNWSSATAVSGEPSPALAGTTQTLAVSNLQPDTIYYYAMKASDERANVSGLSNVALVHTLTVQALPPGLTFPQLPDSVCISSSDPYARIAKGYAESQFTLVSLYSVVATEFLGPLATADWQGNGDCWNYSYALEGCTWNYRVCRSGAEYTYTLTLDGSCSGQRYTEWVAYRAVTNENARAGTFYSYLANASLVAAAWQWTWVATGRSGTCTFYEGDPASSPDTGHLIWARSENGNDFDMSYTIAGDFRWDSHVERTSCSGWLKNYQWKATDSRWWNDTDIAWFADGTGHYDIYRDNGQREEHHVW